MKKTQDIAISENITPIELGNVVSDKYTKYAYMSLEDRALPDARDGLKPSQRRILVAMNDLHLTPGGSTKKSAKICGDTSGNYHPHGEAVIYPTMVRLVQDWVLRYPLIMGQGNFGNNDGDPAAAMRYTEAKLSHVGMGILDDISPDTVDYVPTYNDESTEPTVLPGKIPNLIINGCAGIAVGWATDMPPHNLCEVAKCVEAYIKNPAISVSELIKIMPGPDFPTGGKLLGQEGVVGYYSEGRGSLLVEGTYNIETSKTGKQNLVITELPFGVGPADLASDIEAMLEDPKGDFNEIDDYKDLSKENTKVVIGISKGINPQIVIGKLLKHTCLRKKISVNQTVLINGKVVDNASLSLLIKSFVDHRRNVLLRKYNAELLKCKSRVHILEGLISVSSNIDKAIKIIRGAESPAEACDLLIKSGLVTSEDQSKAVLAITLSKLTKLESSSLINEQKEKIERISWLNNVLTNKTEIDNLIISEQQELANKFGDNRRTEICGIANDIATEDLVKDEQVVISLTGDGYVKSTAANNYKVQGRGGKGSSGINKKDEGDNVFEMFECSSKEIVMFFTNFGLAYQRKAYEIPQASKTGKGTHVSNMLSLSEGEIVTNMVSIKDINQDGYLTIVTKRGLIKRTLIKEYDTSRKTSGFNAIKLGDNDQVAFAMITDGLRDFFIVTSGGNCVRYSESIVPIQGRFTQGARALKLVDSDIVAQVFTLDSKDDPDILVITSGGFGKKTPATEYRSVSSRNAKGYSVLDKKTLEKRNETIAGACSVGENDSVLILTSKGKTIRIGSSDIRGTGRATKGVRMVSMEDGDFVTKIARLSNCCEEDAVLETV